MGLAVLCATPFFQTVRRLFLRLPHYCRPDAFRDAVGVAAPLPVLTSANSWVSSRLTKPVSAEVIRTGIGTRRAANAGWAIHPRPPSPAQLRRKGNVVVRVVANTKRLTLEAFEREAVSTKVSLICSDDDHGYRRLKHRFPNGVVDHSRGQHVVGAVHTQTWRLLVAHQTWRCRNLPQSQPKISALVRCGVRISV